MRLWIEHWQLTTRIYIYSPQYTSAILFRLAVAHQTWTELQLSVHQLCSANSKLMELIQTVLLASVLARRLVAIKCAKLSYDCVWSLCYTFQGHKLVPVKVWCSDRVLALLPCSSVQQHCRIYCTVAHHFTATVQLCSGQAYSRPYSYCTPVHCII